MNIQELAQQYASWFETATRGLDTNFIRLKTTDENISTLIYEAHKGSLPDDYKYQFVHEALELIAEYEELDEIGVEADIYNSDLLKWLSSNLNRADYVDEAVSEYGYENLYTALRYGQMLEKDEVLQSVRRSLDKILEDNKS